MFLMSRDQSQWLFLTLLLFCPVLKKENDFSCQMLSHLVAYLQQSLRSALRILALSRLKNEKCDYEGWKLEIRTQNLHKSKDRVGIILVVRLSVPRRENIQRMKKSKEFWPPKNWGSNANSTFCCLKYRKKHLKTAS